jgi:hypothetical protein
MNPKAKLKEEVRAIQFNSSSGQAGIHKTSQDLGEFQPACRFFPNFLR